MTYQERIVKMRKEDNSYVSTILEEAIKWNENFDEIIVLCDVLGILDQHNLAVSRNEVKKVFGKYYSREFHADKISYLNWIYKNYHIKSKTKVFTSQVRKNTPLPQFLEPISAFNSLENARDGLGCNIMPPKTETALITNTNDVLQPLLSTHQFPEQSHSSNVQNNLRKQGEL